MSTHRNRISLALLLLSLAVLATPARADVITDWNTVALDAVIAAREAQPAQARSVTMVHVAMFEAINAIEQRYSPIWGRCRLRPMHHLRPQRRQQRVAS